MWNVPVCVRAGSGNTSTEHCTLLAERTGAIELPGCADWVMPNARAAGYYRFTLPPSQLPRLRDNARQLSLAERMAFAYSLVAALRSGALPARDVLAALEPFARDPHGTIAAIPITVFRELDRDHVSGADRAKLRARVIALYRPVATGLGWKPRADETAARRQLRVRVLGLLLDLGDPVTTREAAKLGDQLLAAPGTAFDPDLAALVLAASARTGTARTLAALTQQLTSAIDGQLRNRLLGAIASVRDPKLVADALALAFDPRLRPTERLTIPLAMLGSPDTANAAWLWLQASFDRLLPLLPDRYGGRVPLAVQACDPGRVAEMRAFFTSRVGALAGGPRNLAQSLEAAEQCIATVAAARESVLAYIRGR
jgi:cytosol alanyl aminopeptidase